MRTAIAFLVLIGSAFSQVGNSSMGTAAPGLRLQVRMSSTHLKMTDKIVVTLFFRSPEKDITIWNALGWGPAAGLHLQISDASGREVRNDFIEMYHPLPPDRSGKDALISIGGEVFAGFDSQIRAAELFPAPGRYTIKCLYHPRLPRDFFQGHTIWGNEDGPIESTSVSVLVER